MENNNKYLQKVEIINKTVFEDKDGNTRYNYGFMAKVWNKEKRRYTLEGFLILSQNEYDLKDVIYVKSNKSSENEIYFTEAQLNNVNINCDEELPFDV